MVFFTYISYYFLKIFIEVNLIDGAIHLSNNFIFLIVEECIAPNAYMLITLIFFTLPINNFKLVFSLWFKSIVLFSAFNLIRILFLMWIHITYGLYYFEKYHLIFYQGLSGVVVALIIIYFLRKNSIKKVYPIISDVRYLIKQVKLKKKNEK